MKKKPKKKFKSNWKKQIEFNDLPFFDLKKDYLKLPKEFLEHSGLKSDKDIILYSRKMVLDLYVFLNDEIIKNSKLGLILGCPGTGKSISTLSMLPNFVKEGWEIIWFHLYRSEIPSCVLLNKNGKFYQNLNYADIKEIISKFDEKKKIVLIDGYVSINSNHHDVLTIFNSWVKLNKQNRGIVICSMSSRGKKNVDEDYELGVEEFFFDSWKLEEYQSAIKNEDFFSSIKENLDADFSLDDTHSQLIESKYYFAGNSSRYMFSYPTKKVIDLLNDSIECAQDIVQYIKFTIGDSSKEVINRLFSIYKIENIKKKSIISQYAFSQIGIKFGEEIIKNLYEVIKHDSNPSMDGWFLEIWFFSCLNGKGIKIYDQNNNEEIWKSNQIIYFNPKNPPSDLKNSTWLRPIQWNQGGYDSVFIDFIKDEKKKNKY